MAEEIGVVGAGLMGAGIAQVAARSGYSVVLCDVAQPALDRAMAAIREGFSRLVAKGSWSEAEAEAAADRIVTTTDLEELAEATLVVEAVFEDLDAKSKIFAVLDRVCQTEAVLATNTSAIPVTQIAAATRRPHAVVGMHFFSPVPVMRLCELVRGYKTSDSTVAIARDVAQRLGKTCIVVNRDVAGFVTTRLIAAICVEAARLCEAGVASAQDIDTACQLGFGHAMGPLATMDLTGVDIMRNATRNIYLETQDEKFAPPELLNRMVTAGDLGRKTGQGFYSYS